MGKRQELRDKRRKSKQRQQWIIVGLVVIGALLIAAALIIPSYRPLGAIATSAPRLHPMAQDNVMGNPTAPVRIDEYSDFQ